MTPRGIQPHHPSAVNNRKARLDRPPSIARCGGYLWRLRNRPAIEAMQVNTGHIFEGPKQDNHLSYLTNKPWWGPTSHGTTSTATTAAVTPGTIPWDPQHPQRPRLRARVGHQGSTDWWLLPKDSDRYQYHCPGLLSKTGWDKTWCDRWWSQWRLVALRGEWACSSGTDPMAGT